MLVCVFLSNLSLKKYEIFVCVYIFLLNLERVGFGEKNISRLNKSVIINFVDYVTLNKISTLLIRHISYVRYHKISWSIFGYCCCCYTVMNVNIDWHNMTRNKNI